MSVFVFALFTSTLGALQMTKVHQPGMATTMAGLGPDSVALACPEWEAALYQERVCKSYTCNTCAQEWCKNLCHELKIQFGAYNKIVCEPPEVDESGMKEETPP